MYTNTKITLYRLVDKKYERSVHDVFWNDKKISNFNKTGLTTCDTALVLIPHNGIDLTFITGKDYIVKGECEIQIDNTTPQLFSNSMKALKEYGYYTIMSADAKLFGSKDMWHYKLSCK